jgi:predicted benzoate:H+ symporter BenE
VWYLFTGLVCIGFGGTRALSPWAMAIPFGAGQMMVAGILFFSAKEWRSED